MAAPLEAYPATPTVPLDLAIVCKGGQRVLGNAETLKLHSQQLGDLLGIACKEPENAQEAAGEGLNQANKQLDLTFEDICSLFFQRTSLCSEPRKTKHSHGPCCSPCCSPQQLERSPI